ncbi:DUF805 domain-containing protein [Sphingomonas sp. RS6]
MTTALSYRDGVSIRTGIGAIARSLVFRGRSTRTELVSALILIGLAELLWRLVTHFFHPPTATGIETLWRHLAFEQAVSIALLAPLPALIVRRLHDVGLPAMPGLLLAGIAVMARIEQLQVAVGLHPGIPMLPPAGAVSTLILAVALLWSPARGANRCGPDPRG